MVFEKTEFLFWGWLKAYISFSFYKVVAAAAMSVLGQMFFGYYQGVASISSDQSASRPELPHPASSDHHQRLHSYPRSLP